MVCGRSWHNPCIKAKGYEPEADYRHILCPDCNDTKTMQFNYYSDDDSGDDDDDESSSNDDKSSSESESGSTSSSE